MYLDPEEREIRRVLIEVASVRGTITYRGLIQSLGLPYNLKNADDRHMLALSLCDICEYEHEDFRPLLSVLVVNESGIHRGRPSPAFFEFARKIGKHRDDSDEKFLYYETRKVWKQWEVNY